MFSRALNMEVCKKVRDACVVALTANMDQLQKVTVTTPVQETVHRSVEVIFETLS